MSKRIPAVVLAVVVAQGLLYVRPAVAAAGAQQVGPTSAVTSVWQWLEGLMAFTSGRALEGSTMDPDGKQSARAPEGGIMDPDGKHSISHAGVRSRLQVPVSRKLLRF